MRDDGICRLYADGGAEVTLLAQGASIARICVPDRNGRLANVALTPKGPKDPSLAGRTLAPYAGRIEKGRLPIDGQVYQLTCNEGGNHIHGGPGAPVYARWRCEGISRQEGVQQAVFSTEAEDGLDGYPGNRHFTVSYRLWADARLEIRLTAETDRPTRVNLSNHVYVNLSGDFERGIGEHRLRVNADEVYLNDDAFLMAARQTPPGPLDFRRARRIGAAEDHPQKQAARGLNHCYVLNRREDGPAAALHDPGSGRRMRLYTDQPCVMIYSGGFLPVKNAAIALEAQEHPLAACAPQTPVLRPGQRYERRILLCFDTADGL